MKTSSDTPQPMKPCGNTSPEMVAGMARERRTLWRILVGTEPPEVLERRSLVEAIEARISTAEQKAVEGERNQAKFLADNP